MPGNVPSPIMMPFVPWSPARATGDPADTAALLLRLAAGDRRALGEALVLVSLRALELAPRGAGVLNSLGSKDIDGVRANGERTTWTIAAGRIGNEKPIVIVREVWTAPDLMLTLRSRDFDPRSNEVNYRLQNLKRGEPDAALMRVPADYTVRKPAPRASSATG